MRAASRSAVDSARLYLLTIAGAFACALTVPLVRRLALALGVVDRPDGRRPHAEPTARLGGVAIFGSFVAALGLALLLGAPLEGAARANLDGVLGFALGAAIVFAVGVVDDVRGLSPLTKLAVEVVASLVMVEYGGCRINKLSAPGGSIELGPLVAPAATVLWIVAVTNALNLMDGLDGLAAGVTVIALGAVSAIAGPAHASVSVIAAILIGVSIGFLLYNFHPATIFMGDSGSLFLGFSLGVLSTYANAKSTAGAITLGPVLIVALPLTDILWAMGRRYVRGLVPMSARSHLAGVARMFVPDRHHIHHRLVAAGLAQREAIYVLYGVQAAACAGAIYMAVLFGTGRGAEAKAVESGRAAVVAPSSDGAATGAIEGKGP
jgi:UDP-GlcNAc:undecaprenyl-phosphate GlcNAc-1-phosphate transferase